MNTKKLLMTLIGALFITLFTFSISAQESKTETTGFLIFVKKTDNTITLKCAEGCAWTDLTFNLNRNLTQALDEFGTKTNSISDNKKEANLANFLLTIEQTGKGVTLKGIEGTTWTDLSFDFSILKSQAITAKGLMPVQ